TVFRHVFYAITAIVMISVPAYSQKKPIPKQSDEEERLATPARQQVEKSKKAEFEFRYWIPKSSASVNVTENIVDSNTRIKAGVGLDSKNSPDVRFTWQITQRNKLRIDYMQMTTRGDTANFAINLSGGSFLSGENISIDSLKEAELKMKQ